MNKYLILIIICFLSGCANKPVDTFIDHYVNSDPARPFATRFLGVESWQNPADLWVYREIITEVKPDIIIETGTAKGGTALYFANLLDELGTTSKVITIDINPQIKKSIGQLKDRYMKKRAQYLAQRYVEVVKSSSIDENLIQLLKTRIIGKRVLVTLDSCHNTEHVYKEMELYSELVSVGSYLIVQDTIIDNHSNWIKKYARCPGYKSFGGPNHALEKYIKKDNHFIQDRTREKFLLTFHRGGYLKKIK